MSSPGFFWQMDAPTGRYEDAPLGLGWQGPSLDYRKLEKLEKDPRFLSWMENPLFERIARALIPGDICLYRAILFHKGQRGGSELPWHQDGGKLWGLTKDPELQLWTALDDAPLEGGCVEVVAGSHRWGLATTLGGVVPPEQVEAREAARLAVPLPVQAGEVLLLHNYVVTALGALHKPELRLPCRSPPPAPEPQQPRRWSLLARSRCAPHRFTGPRHGACNLAPCCLHHARG